MAGRNSVSGARIASPARRWLRRGRFLAYKPDSPATTVDQVRDAVDSANRHSLERAVTGVCGDVVVAVGAEFHVRLGIPWGPAECGAWLEDLAAALPAGEVTRPRYTAGPEAALMHRMSIRPVTAFLGQRTDAEPAQLLAELVGAVEGDDTVFVTTDEAGMPVDRVHVPALLREIDFTATALFVADEHAAGCVATDPPATWCYQRRATWQ